MTPAELLKLFRSTVFDTVEPFYYSDEEAVEYMNDAQSMFCRLSFGIKDSTTAAVTRIPVAADDVFVPLHEAVLKIVSAVRGSDFTPLSVCNAEDFINGNVPGEDDYGRYRPMVRLDDTKGALRHLISDMQEGQLRLVRIPMEADTIALVVERLPLVDIRLEDFVDPPPVDLHMFEIRREHHRHLVNWMGALAYRKQDSEVFDKAKADEFEVKFRAYCDQARREKERREHKPRTIAYGGY